MKKVLFYISAILIVVLLSYCHDDGNEQLTYATTQTVDVSDINKDGATLNGKLIPGIKNTIVSYGFVWGETPLLSINNSEVITLNGLVSGNYSARVLTSLTAGKEYYVRSFVVSSTNGVNHTYYAETVTFISLGSAAPEVIDFTPHKFNLGDTVTIQGKYFSSIVFRNEIRFGTILAGAFYSDGTTIKVIVPDSLTATKVPVSVSVSGNKGTSPQVYEINPPEIASFYPDYGYNGNSISVSGKNFIKKNTTLKFGSSDFIITYFSPTYIQATVQGIGGTHPLTIQVFDETASSSQNFTNYSPTINSVTPLNGTFNDLITITGEGLNGSCYIGGVYAEIISSTSTEMVVKIPPDLSFSSADIMLSSWMGSIIYPQRFTLNQITADSFSPSTGGIGNKVTIKGNNFSTSTYNTKVYFGDAAIANTISATKNEIIVEVPPSAPISSIITVRIADQIVPLPGTFTIEPATITDFQPRKGTTGTAIKITGTNLSSNWYSYGEIKIGPYTCQLNSVTETEINVVLTSDVYESHISPLVVNLGSQQLTYQGTFDCIWTRKIDAPVTKYGASYFTYENKGFVTQGTTNDWSNYYSNDLWQYQPTGETWIKKSSSPGTGRTNASSFLIDDKFFLGLGYGYNYLSDFWRYDITKDLWSAAADFPGQPRYMAISFSSNGKGYTGTGYYNQYLSDFWEYDPDANTWKSIGDFPGGARYGGISFEVNDEIIAGLGYGNQYYNDLWKFNSADKTWTQLNNFPGSAGGGATTFKINDTVYVVNNNYSNEVWAYDVSTDTWTQKTRYGGPYGLFLSGFGINGKGYVGLGYSNNPSNNIWEYNPDLDN